MAPSSRERTDELCILFRRRVAASRTEETCCLSMDFKTLRPVRVERQHDVAGSDFDDLRRRARGVRTLLQQSFQIPHAAVALRSPRIEREQIAGQEDKLSAPFGSDTSARDFTANGISGSPAGHSHEQVCRFAQANLDAAFFGDGIAHHMQWIVEILLRRLQHARLDIRWDPETPGRFQSKQRVTTTRLDCAVLMLTNCFSGET